MLRRFQHDIADLWSLAVYSCYSGYSQMNWIWFTSRAFLNLCKSLFPAKLCQRVNYTAEHRWIFVHYSLILWAHAIDILKESKNFYINLLYSSSNGKQFLPNWNFKLQILILEFEVTILHFKLEASNVIQYILSWKFEFQF